MTVPSAAEVLVVGEALVDIVRGPDGDVEHVGGSPANVALGLGRRGIRVRLLTQIGPDARGAAIREHLRRSGVEVGSESVSAERTSTAIARLGADGAATYEFDIAWNVLPEAPGPAPSLVHTGSIAAFLAPGAASVRNLLQSLPGAVTTFDPNIRPALVGPHADALAAFEQTARLSTVVKMSDEDAAWLYPDLDEDAVLDRVLERGVSFAAITRGSAGAELSSPNARVHVDAPRVDAVDTIGAGDTFMASLIHSVLHDGVPDDAAALSSFGERAARAAAITVSRAGADLPWERELADPAAS